MIDLSSFPPEIEQAGKTILQCYQTLQQNESNVVQEILKSHQQFFQWDHYPPGDARDRQTHSQYYYHSHLSKDEDRLPEHGHFHLFLREPAILHVFKPLYSSAKYQKDHKSDNLCHLFAIAMNDEGYPAALFTVNHWVTGGLWYQAEAVIEMLNHFQIQHDQPSSLTNQWLNAMVIFFKPYLKKLLIRRDEIIA